MDGDDEELGGALLDAASNTRGALARAAADSLAVGHLCTCVCFWPADGVGHHNVEDSRAMAIAALARPEQCAHTHGHSDGRLAASRHLLHLQKHNTGRP